MRNKLGAILLSALVVAVLGCDKLIEETGDIAAPNLNMPGPGDEFYSPHPYLSCVTPEDPSEWEPDPVCYAGCGGVGDGQGTTYVWCNVDCADASDCDSWDPGDSVVACDDGRCRWYCDESHPCPDGLECMDGAQWGLSLPYAGECKALDPNGF